jgi:EmrB/QacA subfamily drug resistance transporter
MSTSVNVPAAEPSTSPDRDRRPLIALSAIIGAQLMLLLDATVVTVAIPGIGSDLGFSPTGMSWVLNVYTLAFGGLLLLGSRIGDLIGRRTALVSGVLAFTAASVLGGFAPSGPWLLVARTLQGAAAALAAPSTLALITTTFKEGPDRNRALSLYSAVAGAGSGIGLIVGGLLTDYGNWRWVFFINIPLGVAVALLVPRHVAETQRHSGGPFDLTGALTGTLGMASLVYAFIRAAEEGWGDGRAVASFAAAGVLLAAFLVNETRVRRPLVVLRLFADRNRAIAYACMLLTPAGMFGIFYFTTQYLQTVRGYSPLKTGLGFLPMVGLMFVTARTVPRVVARFGAKRSVMVGGLLTTGGTVWLAQLAAGDGYASALLGPLMLVGVGIGLTMMPLNTLILSGVRPQDAGSAAGLLQTMQQIGGSLGLSILVSVFGTATRHTGAGSDFVHGASAAFAAAAVFTALAWLLALAVRAPAGR